MDDIIDFMKYVHKLKKLKRAGWVECSIKNPESVADHSFGTALLAMLLAKKFKLNENKTIKMALIHDLAESVTGDSLSHIVEKDEKLRKKKSDDEKKAMKKIFRSRKEYYGLWLEFEEQKTREAKILRQLDRLELMLQVHGYEKEKNLDCFWEDAERYFQDKELRKIFEELKKGRFK
jgi:putative hydrolase of HD superfamily